MFARAKPQPVIVRDTREQRPFEFPNYSTVDRKLEFGDYAIAGFENVLAVERKNWQDYCVSVSAQHDRFWRELERAKEVGARLVIVVEGLYEWIGQRAYPGAVHPHAILGATAALAADGIPVLFCGDHAEARDACERLLLRVWDLHRERRLREFQTSATSRESRA